jgi:N-acetylmuramoyl-L-alanine amidase
MNSYGASKYSGLQVYYTDENQKSYALADSIQSSVKGILQPENDRKIKSGRGLYLLDNSPVCSVIVECGFLTNSAELKKLSEKEYQKQLSFSIVCGIIEYIEKKQS